MKTKEFIEAGSSDTVRSNRELRSDVLSLYEPCESPSETAASPRKPKARKGCIYGVSSVKFLFRITEASCLKVNMSEQD